MMNSIDKSTTFLVILYICGLCCNHNVQGQSQWGKKTRCLSAPIMSSKVEKTIKKCQEEVKIELIEETLQLYHEYRENLEAQLHAQAHALQHEQQQNNHEAPLEVVQDFGEQHPQSHFHPDFYTTHGFEEIPDSDIEASQKKGQNVPTTPKMTQAITRSRRDASSDWFHPTLISHEDKWIAGCLMQCIYRKNDAVDKNGWPTLDGLVSLYTEGVNEQGYFMNALRAVDTCLKGASKKHKVNRNDIPSRGPLCEVSFDVFDCISDKITEYCSGHSHGGK